MDVAEEKRNEVDFVAVNGEEEFKEGIKEEQCTECVVDGSGKEELKEEIEEEQCTECVIYGSGEEELKEGIEEEHCTERVIDVIGEEELKEGIEEVQCTERVIDNNGDNEGNEASSSVNRDSSSGKIFVGGVPWHTTEEAFSEHFRKYCEIIDSVIMKDKLTKKPRGFGFVTFSDPTVVDRVLQDDHVINGKTVEVKRTVPREDMQQQATGVYKTKKIFVGGIPSSLTEDNLKEYFSSYGNIVEHMIVLDHRTRRSRGFGFVTFENEETVEDIISEGKVHLFGDKQVEIKKAERKRGGGADHGFGDGNGGGGCSVLGYGGGYVGAYVGGYAEGYGGGPGYFYGGYNGYGYGVGNVFGGPPMYANAGYGGRGYGYGYGNAYGGSNPR